jgi:nucleotide-binding universal stress UspA family protein
MERAARSLLNNAMSLRGGCTSIRLDGQRGNMWLTKKILFPTDFENSSRAASDIAVELAQRFHVPILAIHVFPIPKEIYSDVPFIPTDEYLQWVEDSARESLDREATRLQASGVTVSSILKMGCPWEEIVVAANHFDPGLIVMGTHGRRGLSRAFLGSVAEKVVRLSPVPVLTIRGATEKIEVAKNKSEVEHA